MQASNRVVNRARLRFSSAAVFTPNDAEPDDAFSTTRFSLLSTPSCSILPVCLNSTSCLMKSQLLWEKHRFLQKVTQDICKMSLYKVPGRGQKLEDLRAPSNKQRANLMYSSVVCRQNYSSTLDNVHLEVLPARINIS